MAEASPELVVDPRYLRRQPAGAAGGRTPRAAALLLDIAGRAGLEVTCVRSLTLLHRGDEHFAAVSDAIAAARREVVVEMYQIRPDPVGWAMCTALADAALRGVSVRLLLDPFGSSRVAAWLEGLCSHGVAVRWYNGWRPWRNPFRRTHRKLIVVDGRFASIGGVNLAAEFSERHAGAASWRDMALWLDGGAAWLLRRQFDAAWKAQKGRPGPPLEVPGGSGPTVALSGGTTALRNHGAGYLALARCARRELLLATPYFMPDRRLRESLVEAVRRGVRVVVVVPRPSDLWWFKHGSRRRYQQLLEAGIEIWERCDRMVHAKVGVADGMVAAIGSTNLNRLSFHGNSETLLLTADEAVVDGVRGMLLDESAQTAEPLREHSWRHHPDRQRLAELVSAPMELLL